MIIYKVTCQVNGVDVEYSIDPPVRVVAGQRVRIGVFQGKGIHRTGPESPVNQSGGIDNANVWVFGMPCNV